MGMGVGHRRLISERDGRFPDSLRHAGLTVRSTELNQSAVLATLLLQTPLQPQSSSDPGGSGTLNVKSTFMVSSHKGTLS